MFSRKAAHLFTCIILLSTSCFCARLQLSERKHLMSQSSRAPKQQTDRIVFYAGSDVTLYVNGLEKIRYTPSDGIAYFGLNLFNGDVVGLKVSNTGGERGVAAEIVFRNERFVTGRDQWVAAGSSRASNAWLKTNYRLRSICKWKFPQILQTSFLHSYKFSRPSAARLVWARDAAAKDTIFLRYKIGGDNCASMSTIHFAADNKATLFINGNQIESSGDWREYVSLQKQLNKGDVVALKVKDTGVWFGAILAINLGRFGGWHVTGKGEWGATKAFKIIGDENAWTYTTYNACEWPTPELRAPGTYVPGKAEAFPYVSTDAEYVWASNAEEYDEIFLRTVVGEGG